MNKINRYYTRTLEHIHRVHKNMLYLVTNYRDYTWTYTVNEDKGLDHLRVVVVEMQGQIATERQPSHYRLLHPKVAKQMIKVVHHDLHRVLGGIGGAFRLTMAAQVPGDETVVARERLHLTLPHLGGA